MVETLSKRIGKNVNEFLILQSHHRPREGPFELNDVFAITNAVPAIALLSYGLFNKGLVPGLCFGAVSFSFLPSVLSFLFSLIIFLNLDILP